MFQAFAASIKVTTTGKVAYQQNKPRKAFMDFLIAKVVDDQIVAYTCPKSTPVHFEKQDQTLDPTIEMELKGKWLSPADFFSQYPRDEAYQDIESGLLQRYPSSNAALVGLGALAMLTRREVGMMELACLEKPQEYFPHLALAVEMDSTLIDEATLHAGDIGRLLYREKAVNALVEQMDDKTHLVWNEPYRSVFLAGLSSYIRRDGGSDLNLSFFAERAKPGEHAGYIMEMLGDFFKSPLGSDIEAALLHPALIKYLSDRSIKVKTSDIYAPRALSSLIHDAKYIEAGYDWRLSPDLAGYAGVHAAERGSLWAQDMLKIFKSKNMKTNDFWGLSGAKECARGCAVLGAIKKTDPKGFAEILRELPQWAKMACLALSVVSIHEVENVPSAGRDASMSQDLGL